MKTRITKNISPVLTGLSDVDQRLHDLATDTNYRIALVSAMDDEILQIKKQYETQINEAEARIKQITDDLEAWASANPDLFTKRKSIEFLNGVIGFRTGTPKLVPLSRGWTWEKITKAVCAYLPNFTRSKPEVDKQAIIAQAAELEAILPRCGIKVMQGEKFFVEPKLTEKEVAA